MDPFFVRRMVKIELHTHLEGTMEPDLRNRLGAKNGIEVPLYDSSGDGKFAFHDLSSFLAIYYGNIRVLQTKEDFFDLCWSYMRKCREETIIHSDLFFDPQAHTSRGVSFSTVMDGLVEGLRKGREELGVSASLIMCFMRDMDVDSAVATLDEASKYRDFIVGVGLDSDEKDNPPNKFADVFARARQEGYKLTCHCDIDQPNSIEHIRQAIDDIGVDRIDHGTNVVEDDSLVQKLIDKGIGLTCCPISNSVVTRDFKGEEILSLLRRGVQITINSDDPAYMKGYLSDNLIKMTMETDIRRAELIKMQRNALNMAWVNDAQRRRLKAAFDQWVISVELCG